jgi:hypothetical protein
VTFLKKLGQVLLKVVAIGAGIGPVILPFLGSGKAQQVGTTAVNDLTQIGQVVVQIETAFAALPPGTTGAQKLAAALPLVANIIKTSELVINKQVANEALFTQACTEYTQATVDLLNSLHENNVKTA